MDNKKTDDLMCECVYCESCATEVTPIKEGSNILTTMFLIFFINICLAIMPFNLHIFKDLLFLTGGLYIISNIMYIQINKCCKTYVIECNNCGHYHEIGFDN